MGNEFLDRDALARRLVHQGAPAELVERDLNRGTHMAASPAQKPLTNPTTDRGGGVGRSTADREDGRIAIVAFAWDRMRVRSAPRHCQTYARTRGCGSRSATAC